MQRFVTVFIQLRPEKRCAETITCDVSLQQRCARTAVSDRAHPHPPRTRNEVRARAQTLPGAYMRCTGPGTREPPGWE
eukprot:469179-Pleurochrysis_carterae.AAC.3